MIEESVIVCEPEPTGVAEALVTWPSRISWYWEKCRSFEFENLNVGGSLNQRGFEPSSWKLPGTVGATLSTIQVNEAAVVEWLAAASMALTANVCEPSESDPSVFGEPHDVYEPPSVEHS